MYADSGKSRPIILPAGSFDVVLLFDHREQAGMGGFALEGTLDRRKIKYDRRSLFLGDYLWVAQRKVPLGDACTSASERLQLSVS